jgi:hypothetical protein
MNKQPLRLKLHLLLKRLSCATTSTVVTVVVAAIAKTIPKL